MGISDQILNVLAHPIESVSFTFRCDPVLDMEDLWSQIRSKSNIFERNIVAGMIYSRAEVERNELFFSK